MTRTVYCKKLKQQAEGLDFPPLPGAKGKELFETVSKAAWQQWQKHQTMLINERRLNMLDPKAREFLTQEMDKFFAGEDFAQAEGYVPPQES